MDAVTTARLRARAQHLWAEPLISPGEVVRFLGAVQAQEYVPAKWGLAQRCGATERDVDQAIAAGEIIRTHILRPTWHFVHRDDLRWLLAVSAPRVHAVNGYWYRRIGLTEERAAATQAILREALTGTELSRRELARLLDAEGIALAYVLMRAELDGVICSGAPRGKTQTYALVDERVPASETQGDLAERYLHSRGPASPRDFATWSGLTMADARAGFARQPGIEQVAVGDHEAWWLPQPIPPPASGRIDLVQGYDETIMSYSETRDALNRSGAEPVREGRLHVMLLDGQVVGRWGHELTAKLLTVSVVCPPELDNRLIDEAVGRMGLFFERRATWKRV